MKSEDLLVFDFTGLADVVAEFYIYRHYGGGRVQNHLPESDSYSKKGLRNRSNQYDGTHKTMLGANPYRRPGSQDSIRTTQVWEAEKLESEAEVNAVEDEKPEGLKGEEEEEKEATNPVATDCKKCPKQQ